MFEDDEDVVSPGTWSDLHIYTLCINGVLLRLPKKQEIVL